MKHLALTSLAVLTLSLTVVSAQTPTSTEVAKKLGFTAAEIAQIEGGEIVSKTLNEGSDKELAGVVAVLFKRPVSELVDIAMQGKMLETDKTIQEFRGWKPDASAAEVFADVGLSPTETGEAQLFATAAPGDKLNLSKPEMSRFAKFKTEQVNAELRAMLRARYEAYRQNGLKGIAPYVRGGNKTATPAEELRLAIKETMPAAKRTDYFQALLDYPANQLPDMEHRFYWFKQTVENRPTFILAHRAELHTATAALLTEEQFYVGHSYNSNLIAGGCLAVEGGTLVFYVNRSFTDQVAGFASGMKHGIGRGQMLSEVAANLKRIRDQLPK